MELQVDKVPWTEFVPLVSPHLKGAPDQVIIHEVINATRELCDAAKVLRREYELDAWRGVDTYKVEEPEGAHFVTLMKAELDGRPYPLAPMNAALYRQPGAWFEYPDTIHLYPCPGLDIPSGIYLQFSITPRTTSAEVDAVLLERHSEVVVHGALARLFLYPRTEWTDAVAAQYHRLEFDRAIERLRIRQRRAHQAGPLVARPIRRWI